MCVCKYVFMYVYIYICVCVWVCVCVCVCAFLMQISLQHPVSISGLPSFTLGPNSPYLIAYIVIQRRQMKCGST